MNSMDQPLWIRLEIVAVPQEPLCLQLHDTYIDTVRSTSKGD